MSIGIPGGYYGVLSQIESGGGQNNYNPTTGAFSQYQFLQSTWTGLGYSPSQEGDTSVQNTAIQKLTMQNATILSNHRIPITDESLYTAHFLGAGTAVSLLGAPDNTPVSSLVSGAAIRANPSILGGGQTVGGFKQLISSKVGKASGMLSSDGTGAGRAALTSAGAAIGGAFGNAQAGEAVGNALADVNQKIGQGMLAISAPFTGVTDGMGLTGNCDWLCEFENWIKNSGFFQRLALAILAFIILAAAFFSLKDVRNVIVQGANAATA